ncbi:transposase [Sagittula sp. NFXS13]
MSVPGVGPLIATVIVIFAPTPEAFCKARSVAAF